MLDIEGASQDGLLFELFSQGCRISNVHTEDLHAERSVTLRIDGFGDIPAQVHCTYDGVVRLRFVRPLANSQLRSLTGNRRNRPSAFQPAFFFAA